MSLEEFNETRKKAAIFRKGIEFLEYIKLMRDQDFEPEYYLFLERMKALKPYLGDNNENMKDFKYTMCIDEEIEYMKEWIYENEIKPKEERREEQLQELEEQKIRYEDKMRRIKSRKEKLKIIKKEAYTLISLTKKQNYIFSLPTEPLSKELEEKLKQFLKGEKLNIAKEEEDIEKLRLKIERREKQLGDES